MIRWFVSLFPIILKLGISLGPDGLGAMARFQQEQQRGTLMRWVIEL
jgi:hypothetical protein